MKERLFIPGNVQTVYIQSCYNVILLILTMYMLIWNSKLGNYNAAAMKILFRTSTLRKIYVCYVYAMLLLK